MCAVNEAMDLPSFRRTTFQGVLKKLGFKFHMRERNMFLSDRDDFSIWRQNYLRKIQKFREGRPIQFQDETWVNERHTKNKVWVDGLVKCRKDTFLNGLATGLKSPSCTGKQIIVRAPLWKQKWFR